MPFKIAALVYLLIVAALLGILSKGDFTGIGSDFSFYYDPLVNIRDLGLPFWDLFNPTQDAYLDSPDLSRVSSWVPSPFYSYLFLGPFFLHQSQLIFAIQGILVAWVTLLNIQYFCLKIYGFLGQAANNLIVVLSALNPAFLKDALTSGPVSLCNLFILLAFRFWNNPIASSLLFACAAMVRSSYFIYVIAIYLACLLISRRSFLAILSRTYLSIIVYSLFYSAFYSTYPGSGLAYIFVIGLAGMEYMDNYFVQLLSTHYSVNSIWDVLDLDISFYDLASLVFSDLRIAYGVFVIWIFKIFGFLGFPHLQLLWDMRSIWIQRLATLIYFIVVMAPGFVLSTFALAFAGNNKKFWNKSEKVIVLSALIFTLLHSLIMGTPRYSIIISWIFSAFLIRFVAWYKAAI